LITCTTCTSWARSRQNKCVHQTQEVLQAKPDMYVPEKHLVRAIGLVKGDIDPGMFFDAETLVHIARVFEKQSQEWLKKRAEVEAFGTKEEAPFPSQPDLADKVVVV
jgi:hypothetical protein